MYSKLILISLLCISSFSLIDGKKKRTVTTNTTPVIIDDFDDYVPYQGEIHDGFDWELAQNLLLKPIANVVVSPISIKLLLVILSEAAGANSQTQKELSIILPNIVRPYQGRSIFEKILSSLKAKNDGYEFKMGTRIFVDQFIEPTQRYSAIVENYYDTLIERLDFRNPKPTADYINKWCSNITNGHIKNFVQDEDINKSVMIMLNAIYFSGLWRRPFPRNETSELSFYISSSQQIKTTFMQQTARYYFIDSPKLNAKILRIPYKGRKFAMFIVLPNSKEGIGELIRQLDSTTLRRTEWLMDEAEVRVAIPTFKFETTTDLNPVLQELGIREIFTNEASLPLLSRGQGLQNQLQVSNITQKAGIKVDEEGSVAYAVTEITLVNKFGDSPKEFIADRPFLFFIQDETTGTLLYAGKVGYPAEFDG